MRERSFPSFEIIAGSSVEEVDINIKDMLPGLFQGRTKKRRVKVPEALDHLLQEEEQKLVDMESVARDAVERVEQSGHHLRRRDRQDRGPRGRRRGPTSAAKGVQRDILPIVEGTTVNTKYGMVRTDHILFIAAGAFHVSKPSDLIPELQGRFPIRVELELARQATSSSASSPSRRTRWSSSTPRCSRPRGSRWSSAPTRSSGSRISPPS